MEQEGGVRVERTAQKIEFVLHSLHNFGTVDHRTCDNIRMSVRYLVQLWRETSKPHSTGRKFSGPANVLSISETSPFDLAKSTTARTLGTCKQRVRDGLHVDRSGIRSEQSFPGMRIFRIDEIERRA